MALIGQLLCRANPSRPLNIEIFRDFAIAFWHFVLLSRDLCLYEATVDWRLLQRLFRLGLDIRKIGRLSFIFGLRNPRVARRFFSLELRFFRVACTVRSTGPAKAATKLWATLFRSLGVDG